MIVSDITNPFFPELIDGFEQVAVRAGFEVLLGSTNYDPAMMATVVRRMIERNVEGVAVMTSEMEGSGESPLTSGWPAACSLRIAGLLFWTISCKG